MQKYKCVKRYPNGPDIGTIVTKDALGQYVQEHPLWIHSWEEIENFTEFWEEVKEKEFEILEFKVSYDDRIIKLNSDGSYSSDGGIPASLDMELQWVKDGTRIISKVKRLSDGEIFSVRDRVYYTEFSNNVAIKVGTPFTIDNFYIRNDGVLLVRSKDNLVVEIISTIKHSAKPLFLDELGNEVFEGDKYYFVWKFNNQLQLNSCIANETSGKEKCDKYFKFESDAVVYINDDDNKPRFSKKQVLDALEWGYLHSIVATEMYRAVKMKLDL